MIQKSELFVQHLVNTLGDYSSIVGIETKDQALGMVLGVIYQHYPQPGLTTGFTYGLSAAEHPEWKDHKPELSITVESSEDDWVTAVAQLVEWHRTHHPFKPGSLFHFGKAIAPDSLMDSFLIFNSIATSFPIGEPVEGQSAAIPTVPIQPIPLHQDSIQVYQAYPLYHNEVELIKKVGIRKFTGLREYELYSVQRPDLSKIYQVG